MAGPHQLNVLQRLCTTPSKSSLHKLLSCSIVVVANACVFKHRVLSHRTPPDLAHGSDHSLLDATGQVCPECDHELPVRHHSSTQLYSIVFNFTASTFVSPFVFFFAPYFDYFFFFHFMSIFPSPPLFFSSLLFSLFFSPVFFPTFVLSFLFCTQHLDDAIFTECT